MENFNNSKAIQKSVTPKVVRFTTYKRGIRFFSFVTALATVLTMSVTLALAKQVKKNNAQYKVDKSVVKIIEGENTGNIVTKHTYRVNGGKDYAYNIYGMAEDIINVDPSYLDIVLFSAYKNMKYKDDNLDELFSCINRSLESIKDTNPEVYYKLKDVKTFADYLKKLRLVDKDGNILEEAYLTYGENLNATYNKLVGNVPRM